MGSPTNPKPFQFGPCWEGFEPIDTLMNESVVPTLRDWTADYLDLNSAQVKLATDIGLAALGLFTVWHVRGQAVKAVLATAAVALIPTPALIRQFCTTESKAQDCSLGETFLAPTGPNGSYERVRFVEDYGRTVYVRPLNRTEELSIRLDSDTTILKTSEFIRWFELASLQEPGVIDFKDPVTLAITTLLVMGAAACHLKVMSRLAVVLGARHLIREHGMAWITPVHTSIMDRLATGMKRPDYWEALFAKDLACPEENKKALAAFLAQTYGQSKGEQKTSAKKALGSSQDPTYHHLASWATTYNSPEELLKAFGPLDDDQKDHIEEAMNALAAAMKEQRSTEAKHPDYWEALFANKHPASEKYRQALAAFLAQTYGQNRIEREASAREVLGSSQDPTYHPLASWFTDYDSPEALLKAFGPLDDDQQWRISQAYWAIEEALPSPSKPATVPDFDLDAFCQRMANVQGEQEQIDAFDARMRFDPKGHFLKLVKLSTGEEPTDITKFLVWNIANSWANAQDEFSLLQDYMHNWDIRFTTICCMRTWQQTSLENRSELAKDMAQAPEVTAALEQVPENLTSDDAEDAQLVEEILALKKAVLAANDNDME